MHDKSTCLICLVTKAEKARKKAVSALNKMGASERKKMLEEASKAVRHHG